MSKKVFIQTLSVFYNGNLGMLEKEDCVALAANIMAENGYTSIVAAVNTIGISSLKSPDEKHTLPEVEIINFDSLWNYIFLMGKHKNSTVFGNARTLVGLTSCIFGRYRVFMNHHSTLPKKWWQRAVLKLFLTRFDAIKADTEAEKQILVSFGISAEKIFVIPIPIDHEYFSRKPSQNKLFSLRKKFGIKNKEKIVLFLTALRKHKRPDTVLKAMKILKKKGIEVRLVQVGKDALLEQTGKSFISLAREVGVEDLVIQTGRVSDEELKSFMYLADVGVQSADVEGQCIVAFEYAAAGLPECLSNIPSFDIFGENVLRHKSGDYKTLADNIIFYLNNPIVAKEHSVANRKMVKKKYDYKDIKYKMKNILIDNRLRMGK